MIKHICVLGNSHVAAFKRGWDMLKSDFPETSVDFFGASGASIRDVTVSDGTIVAEDQAALSFQRTGGRERVEIADYDLVIVVGCGARLPVLANTLKTYQPPFLNKLLADGEPSELGDLSALTAADPFGGSARPVPVSDALFKEIMAGQVRQSAAYSLVDAISQQASVPLYYVPTPLPSSSIVTSKPDEVVSQVVQMGFGPAFAPIVWGSFEIAMRGKAAVMRTPEDMVVDGIMTEKSFGVGSVRLNQRGNHGEEDVMHMNGEYGAALLRQIFAKAFAGQTEELSSVR